MLGRDHVDVKNLLSHAPGRLLDVLRRSGSGSEDAERSVTSVMYTCRHSRHTGNILSEKAKCTSRIDFGVGPSLTASKNENSPCPPY